MDEFDHLKIDYLKRICPICRAPAVPNPSPNEGMEMYVAEGDNSCTKWYDGADPFKCSKDEKHRFYIGVD